MPGARRHKNFQGRNFHKKRRPDILTRRDRSNLMSRIRSSGSQIEIRFATIMASRFKKSFELNDRSVLGKPDIVFREARVCVFLDSDFWHGWQFPRWKHLLKSEFWRTKIERNRQRDKEVTRKLRRDGWTVIRFWEHNLRRTTERAIAAVLSSVLAKKRR
jgi:DNA mismatch endonuclease, patch repair protein